MTDIIIFCGQSNMEGQTERLIDSSIVSNAYEYKYASNTFVPLRDPFGENLKYDGTKGEAYEDSMGMTWHDKHVLGGSAYGHTTLIPEFCRVYTTMTKREVIAVGAAKGAVTIDYFTPGNSGYDILVKKTNCAKSKSGTFAGNVYLVFLQGESDAIISKSKDKYKEQIKLFAHSLVKDVGLSRFGVIRVGRFTNDDRDLEIIKAQDEICIEDDLFLMLTDEATALNSMPEYINPIAPGHFNAEGLQKLGHDAALTLAHSINIKDNV